MKDFTLKQCKYTISHKNINPYTFDDFYEYYIKDNVHLTFTYNERLKYMFKIHSGLEKSTFKILLTTLVKILS